MARSAFWICKGAWALLREMLRKWLAVTMASWLWALYDLGTAKVRKELIIKRVVLEFIEIFLFDGSFDLTSIFVLLSLPLRSLRPFLASNALIRLLVENALLGKLRNLDERLGLVLVPFDLARRRLLDLTLKLRVPLKIVRHLYIVIAILIRLNAADRTGDIVIGAVHLLLNDWVFAEQRDLRLLTLLLLYSVRGIGPFLIFFDKN